MISTRKPAFFLIACVLLLAFILPAWASLAYDTIRPNADGHASTYLWFIYPASPTTHYDKVDDSPKNDGDATYICTSEDLTVRVDRFNYSDCGLDAGTSINDVTVWGTAKRYAEANPVAPSFNLGIYKNVTAEYFSTSFTLTASYANYSKKYTTRPWDSQPWTVGDIDSVAVMSVKGVSARKSVTGIWWYTTVMCTQAWMVINYTVSAGGQEKTFLAIATPKATASASSLKEIKLGTSTATLKSTATTQTYKEMLLGPFTVFGHGTTWNDYLKSIILYGAVTGNLNLWVKSWNSSIPAGYPQQPEITFPPSLSVLFKTYLDEKPLPDVEISVYETIFNGLVDSAVTDMTGRATIYLFPGDYRYEALHTRSNITREGHFLHFTYETIEIDFGTGEVKITPTTLQVLLRMVTMLCVTALGCVSIWRLKKREK